MATLTRGEVRLAYEEAGRGEPAMVFVHGWSCNRAFFGPQIEHFSRQRRCVGVDLRGHGDSDKPRQDYTGDDPARRSWIMEQMLATPQHVMLSATEQGGRCDMVAAASACRVPALYIQAGRPRPELARFEQLCPQLVLGRTVGSGHFNQLEVPDQVNAMIERFLQMR